MLFFKTNTCGRNTDLVKVTVVRNFPNVNSLPMQKLQSSQITTSQIKTYPSLMEFLCSPVALRGNGEAANTTTTREGRGVGRKETKQELSGKAV